MKIILLILFLIPLQMFSQENPWENKSKSTNPWEKKEDPKKAKTDSSIVSIKKVDSTNATIETVDSLNIETQTIKIDSTKTLAESSTKTKTQLTPYELEMVRIESRQAYKPRGTLISSVLSSAVFFFYALPVNFGLTFLNSEKERTYLSTYKDEHPDASEKEMKYVKKGIKSKKRRTAVGGSFAGMSITVLLFIVSFN